MAYILMYIPFDDTQISLFRRLQLVVETVWIPTNQNLIKVLKVVKRTNKKKTFKNFGN